MSEYNRQHAAARSGAISVLLLCVAGILINLGGYDLSLTLGLPIYFDTAGTILCAALGGALPGVLAGFCTNAVLGLWDPSMFYYGVINMIVALCAAAFARKGYFKRFPKVLLVIPPVTLIMGVLGAGLTWYLNDSNIGGQFTGFAMRMHEQAGIGRFGAQMTADLLYELLDKTVSILLVYLALRYLPKAFLDRFNTEGRWQSPLSEEMKAAINRQKGRGLSLRTRVLLVLTAGMICITATACIISFRLFKDSTIDEYSHMARLLTSMVAGLLEDQPVEDFIERGRAAEGYEEFEQTLYKLKDSYPDVEYLYVYQITEEGCRVVFDLDTEEVEASEPGSIEAFDESFAPYLPALLRGEPIDPIVSDDTFGWLLTVYYPVRSNHQTLCYVGADYSMSMLSFISGIFFAKLISLLVSVFILVLVIAHSLAEHNVILPVKSMSYCAGAFAYDSEEARESNVEQLRRLEIRTGDEIEDLYHAFLKTTEDSMSYVDNLLHARLQVAEMKEQVTAMDEIAYKDALTGLRNKASYDRYTTRLDAQIAQGEDPAFGIAMIDLNYLKRVNDTYGHENGNVYIKQCCQLVCTIFDHSPVFRVGGDEFVVILENSDLQGYEKLIKRFKYEIKKRSQDETLEPWEKVSAAVGVAVYDGAADHSADDVFKRADQAMYADKQAMKAVRLD